jgi:Peptidase family M1 domain
MYKLILGLCITLMTGCSALATSPTPTTLSPSPQLTRTISEPSPTPSSLPTVSGPASPFAAALLPEFRGDLSLVHSPTIYRMNLRLDPSRGMLSGNESVTFTNRTPVPLGEVYFRLFPNYPSPQTTDEEAVKSVRVNGIQVTPILESQDTALRVPLAEPLVRNETATFNLEFDVTIPISNTTHYSDFTNSQGIITLPSAYPLIPVYDGKGWHTELPPQYGDLVYADASLYDVTLTAPITMTVIASGSTLETTTQGDEKTWHLVGAPMRDFDIDASASLQRSTTRVGAVMVNSYFLSQDESAGQDVLKWASGALAVYQKRFGAYPFSELDVIETPTTAGGIEYPGAVVIASDLYRDPKQNNFFEFAVVHEVSHQWWYAQVGDDQVNTPWMDEALAQYSSLIYYQDTYGAGAGDQILKNVFQSQYEAAKRNNEDKPVGLPVADYTEKQYGEIVYGKGPLFFDAVRRQIGDDAFFKFLQTYYVRFKYQIAAPEDMLHTMDQVSGQNVDALYDRWILGQ